MAATLPPRPPETGRWPPLPGLELEVRHHGKMLTGIAGPNAVINRDQFRLENFDRLQAWCQFVCRHCPVLHACKNLFLLRLKFFNCDDAPILQLGQLIELGCIRVRSGVRIALSPR